ncbi:hypothetical protein CKO15_03205 [Halorhodospira abdelmalekii]|uniref:bifunctional diguanylate cyclase/phosphodiesterase n=1 Tax=Halorhodospira abdelmalekii TaxID=421629 RepID=UPI0019081E93|nr:EAL domain-containing protein [Halorhodospira abdelmalekii]MBK1734306.1 hypothetical protein [Halorhodospira abdelmalekii]
MNRPHAPPPPIPPRTFSLRWKLLLAFGAVLLLLLLAQALSNEVSLQRQYADERAQEQTRAAMQLQALKARSRGELLNLTHLIRSLSGVPAALAAGDAERLRHRFAEQWATLQIDTDLAIAAFFDASGELLIQEESFGPEYALPPEASDAVARALSNEEPQLIGLCRTYCLIYAAAPMAIGTETIGAILLGRTLTELVIAFERFSQLDLAILATAETGSPPLADGLDERLLHEGGHIVAATHRDRTLPLLSQEVEPLAQLAQRADREGQPTGWHPALFAGAHYELMPIPLAGMSTDDGHALAVVIADVSAAHEQITAARWQNLAISLGGLAFFAALVVAVTRHPLQRLRRIAWLLPLLAERRFTTARAHLRLQPRRFPDELERLEETTLSLADRLESLEEQVEERNRSLAAKVDELSIERERYELAAAGANDGLWDWDLEHNAVYYSARWWGMIGHREPLSDSSPEQWLGRIHPDEQTRVRQELEAHLRGLSATFESEHRLYHERDGFRWMLVRGLAVRRRDGTAYRMAGSMSDVTERHRIQEQLEHDALHDALTGLPNRNLLLDRLQRVIVRAQRSHENFAVLFLDLDDFKTINDSLGHSYGDEVLMTVSKRLSQLVRPGDTVARLGGDEFIVLLEQIEEQQQVEHVIKRIRSAMVAPILIGPQEIFANFSIGVTLGSAHEPLLAARAAGTGPEETPLAPRLAAAEAANALLRNADTAMYHAKAQNRGNWALFERSMHDHALFRLNLETALRRALETDELELYYQPVVSLPTGKLLGFEALARWSRHDGGGWVSPGDFIPLAERTGLIVPLGQWVIETAIAQAAKLRRLRIAGEEREDDLIMHINVSGKQLRDPELVATLQQALREHDLPGRCLKVEITESTIVENAAAAVVIMRQIRESGAQLCIDDFGTGYSSLSQLRDLPFDVLKIDRSFVSRTGIDARDDAIVEAILSIARALDKEVVAEGIEEQAQVDFLTGLGCRQAQGFFFAKPMPAEALEEWIANRRG